jgi:hypothetical protein
MLKMPIHEPQTTPSAYKSLLPQSSTPQIVVSHFPTKDIELTTKRDLLSW